MSTKNEKRAAFQSSLKVDTLQQNKSAKQQQFSSNNTSGSNDDKGEAPDRQRSLSKGRGNER